MKILDDYEDQLKIINEEESRINSKESSISLNVDGPSLNVGVPLTDRAAVD
jgi:hypothetical protein